MRELLLLALLLPACAPTGPTGRASSGACQEDATQCVDERNIQRCVDGTWSDPEACPPQETTVGPVGTYCLGAGFCGPA